METTEKPANSQKKRENPWISLLFNLAIPSLILAKASGPDRLGPMVALVVALAFPISYGIYDFVTRRNWNIISILGFANVLLTGGIGLLKLGGFWFAAKEAGIPAIIAIAIYVSEWRGKPLVKAMLYNDQIMDKDKVDAAIELNSATDEFNSLFSAATKLIFVSFVISAIINLVLALTIVTSPPGTEGFNEEVAYMNMLSMPVVLVCCSSLMMFALWRLIKGIMRLTGLELEQIIRT